MNHWPKAIVAANEMMTTWVIMVEIKPRWGTFVR